MATYLTNLREQIKFKYCANTKKKYCVFGIAYFHLKWSKSDENHIRICRSCKQMANGEKKADWRPNARIPICLSKYARVTQTEVESGADRNSQALEIRKTESETHRMIRVVFILQFCMPSPQLYYTHAVSCLLCAHHATVLDEE